MALGIIRSFFSGTPMMTLPETSPRHVRKRVNYTLGMSRPTALFKRSVACQNLGKSELGDTWISQKGKIKKIRNENLFLIFHPRQINHPANGCRVLPAVTSARSSNRELEQTVGRRAPLGPDSTLSWSLA